MDFNISIVTDLAFIRSILCREDIEETFCSGVEVTQGNIDKSAGIFFHVENIGLFAANVTGKKELLFHAAIPSENRGIRAIRAARYLGDKLTELGFICKTRNKDIKHQRVFVRMVGFEFQESKDGYNYYIYRGVKNG